MLEDDNVLHLHRSICLCDCACYLDDVIFVFAIIAFPRRDVSRSGVVFRERTGVRYMVLFYFASSSAHAVIFAI